LPSFAVGFPLEMMTRLAVLAAGFTEVHDAKGCFALATREPLCPHKCFMMFYELLCDVSLRKAMAQRFDLYVLSCPALFFFVLFLQQMVQHLGSKLKYMKTGLGILDVWHAILIYCLLRRIATLLSFRVTDPTKVADIDR
jgi:hypothetical protein